MGKYLQRLVFLLTLAGTSSVLADDSNTKDAAIGGAAGGAIGGAIGSELGDRNGAIVGAAIGAAIGAGIATDEGASKKNGTEIELRTETIEISVEKNKHPKGRHCPPGQAKKGRC